MKPSYSFLKFRCPEGLFFGLVGIFFTICLMLTSHPRMGLAADSELPDQGASPQDQTTTLREKWGVEVVSIRLSAAGHMLDFRYRVIDPQKSSPLFDPRIKPSLTDQASGVTMSVPTAPKTGSLRQKPKKPEANRNYFILFTNQGRMVRQGSRVTVVIGEFRAQDLVVQ